MWHLASGMLHCTAYSMLSAKIFDVDQTRPRSGGLCKNQYFSPELLCLRLSMETSPGGALAIRSRSSIGSSVRQRVLLSCRDKQTLINILMGLHPTHVTSQKSLCPSALCNIKESSRLAEINSQTRECSAHRDAHIQALSVYNCGSHCPWINKQFKKSFGHAG